MNADAVLGQQRQRKVRKNLSYFACWSKVSEYFSIFFWWVAQPPARYSCQHVSWQRHCCILGSVKLPGRSFLPRPPWDPSGASVTGIKIFSVWWSKLPMNGLFHGEQTWPAGESLFLTRKNVNMFENGKLLPRFVCFGKDTWIIIGFVSFY